MKWYLSLSIHQRINLKALCSDIVGISFTTLVNLFGFRLGLDLIYDKMKAEGFDI